MATKKGLVKKTPLEEYENVRKTGLAAIALRDDDELIEVKTTDNEKEIILVTKFGQCIRFKEKRCAYDRPCFYGCTRHQPSGRR